MFENWRESLVDIVSGAENYKDLYRDVTPVGKAFQVESSLVDVLSSPVEFPASFDVDCGLNIEKFSPKGKTATLVADGRKFEQVNIDGACEAAFKHGGYIKKVQLVVIGTSDLPKDVKIVEKKDGILLEKDFEVFGKDMVHEWASDSGQRVYSKPHTGARVPLHPYGGMLDREHPLGEQVFLGLGFFKNNTTINIQFAHNYSLKHAYLIEKTQNYMLHAVKTENSGVCLTFKKIGGVFVK